MTRSYLAASDGPCFCRVLQPMWAQPNIGANASCRTNSSVAAQKQVLFDFEALVRRTLAPGRRSYAFQQQMKLPFEIHDTDHDGAITDADRQRYRQRFETMQRAQYISLLLQADLNSDGVITRDELSIFARYSSRQMRGEGPESDARRAEQVRRIVKSRMRADTNGDSKIDWQELFAYAKKYPMVSPTDFDAPYRALLSFDADGDGKTTFKEYTEAMERRFAEFDTDGDGVISRAEFDAYWQRSGVPAPKVARRFGPALRSRGPSNAPSPSPRRTQSLSSLTATGRSLCRRRRSVHKIRKRMTTKVIIEPAGTALPGDDRVGSRYLAVRRRSITHKAPNPSGRRSKRT